MSNAKRDENFVPTLIGVSSVDGTTPITVYVDPTTHRLKVDLAGGGSGNVSNTGTPVDNQIAVWTGATTIEGTAGLTFASNILGVGTAAAGVVSSNGDFNLELKTGNATTGNILITDGADGSIDVTANGAGTLYFGNATDGLTVNSDGSVSFTFGNNFLPGSDDSYNLGSSSLKWSNLFLTGFEFGSNSVIYTPAGNREWLKFTDTASAVNEFTIANAATGNNPSIAASGGDANIGINLVPKGTGVLQVAGVTVPTISSTSTLTNKTLTSPTLTGTPVLPSTFTIGANNFVRSGAHALTLTTTATTNVTLPTTGTLATLAGTETFSNKTLTAPKIVDTGFIADASGNEQIKFSTTASAVNEVTVKNAATGNGPQLQATGGDTNINLNLVPKGTGIVKGELKRFMVRLVASDTATATGTTIGGDYRISNRAITVKAVGAYVDTAGTTGVMTIDINEAGTTILSTKITLDSTEKSSETAATPPVISDSAIAADAIVTIDVDGVQTTPANGLTVWVDYIYA